MKKQITTNEQISKVGEALKSVEEINPPDWASFAKTGTFKERPPVKKDWWYTRCASILRKIYMNNLIGVEHLKAEYGGKRDRGSKPHKAKSGSGTVVRRALQQLEKAGYVAKIKGKGRVLTPKGRSFLDNTSHEVMKDVGSYYPELKKY